MKQKLYLCGMIILLSGPLYSQNEHDTIIRTIQGTNLGITLQAEVMPDYIQLAWRVGPSDQTGYFELHRSPDGRSFTILKQFHPEQPGTVKTNFIFKDEDPLRGKNYYRIISYDRFTQEKRMVDIMAEYNNLPRKLKPSVVVKGSQLMVENYDGDPLQLMIYTSGGSPVMQKKLSSATVNFPATTLVAGVYVYNLFDMKKMLVASGQFIML